MLNLPAIPKFQADSDHSSLATRWKKWRDRFDVYILALGVRDDKQKRALLLHLAGESVQEVFDGLSDTGEDFKTESDKLKEYFEPKKNIRFERYIFKQPSQNSVDSPTNSKQPLTNLTIAGVTIPVIIDTGASVDKETYQKIIKHKALELRTPKSKIYVATPHSTTGVSPAQLLFNRQIKTKLPENSLETPSEDNHQKLARINDKAAKCKMKSYADQKFHAKSSDLMQGDLVLVKQNKVNKLSTPFSAEPSVVLDVKGSMITLKRPNGKVYARNSSLLKRVPTTSNQLNKATSDSEDDIEDDSYAQRPNPVIPQPMRRNPRRHRNRPRYLNDYV
ncbi:hypothetical protein LOTGIDRAFT_161038 [Lottia gigantea]|uniref:Peptidase A2 domain-containing protein n=1 Tax=Lottia gigantea TaxID=225164 RepID=V4AD55_LOTGI|nr:hypothetical protein LOTGIDRAFT_161038 [Lottia gigantea]ESO94787.1 hypothetical protein LOTGIDRAFT_161038 [Lottia gigantea]